MDSVRQTPHSIQHTEPLSIHGSSSCVTVKPVYLRNRRDGYTLDQPGYRHGKESTLIYLSYISVAFPALEIIIVGAETESSGRSSRKGWWSASTVRKA